ncbi:MAG: hypothetical protein L6R38_001631 [Xanthoria sp. 2 TBL-2021]|nr:MAG: hypothetical protein L6R38_001631 [Xanthoria sp. 2 TBL-2021]
MHFVSQKVLNLGCLSLVVSLCLITTCISTRLPADEPADIKLAPAAESNALSITQPELSATLPPSGFRTTVASGDKLIHNQNVFKLSIKVLSTLAAAPSNRRFAAEVWWLPKPSKIGLAIGGPGAVFFSNYTIWGLTLAAKYMVDHRFRNWRFQLHWQNQSVGQIWYVDGNPMIEANSTHDGEISRRADIAKAPAELAALEATPSIEILPSKGPRSNTERSDDGNHQRLFRLSYTRQRPTDTEQPFFHHIPAVQRDFGHKVVLASAVISLLVHLWLPRHVARPPSS